MSLDQTKDALRGEWVSIAPEIRPSATKNPDGTLKPFYLTRGFKYLGNDRFELTINNSADPYGKVPVVRIYLRGHMHWQGDHPIASGARKVDFVAGRNFMEYDLVYLNRDMLFWGARNIDGRGFDKEENRPTNLQIPLVRK